MKRFNGLDTLMSAFGLNNAKSFQAYQDQVLAKIESQNENLEGFVWDLPQIDFTYEQLETEAQIEVMASYVDLNSPALPAGKSVTLTKLKGTIPRMKYAVVRGENDYRKQLITLNEIKAVANYTNKPESEAINEYLAKTLFDTIAELPAAHKNSLNYQVGQMKSKGALTLDDTNNPRGSIRTTFTAQVPTGNFMAKKWWEKASGGAVTPVETADPVAEIRNFIRELRWKPNGYTNVAIEMNEKFAYKFFAHPAVLKAIGYALTPGLRYSAKNDENAIATANFATIDAQKNAFKALVDADVVIYNQTQCGVEKLNTEHKRYERTLLNAFDEDVILVRPAGQIGVIKNVTPLIPDGTSVVARTHGGRGYIEYIYDADTHTQTWRSELTALAVPTRPKDMYYFNNLTQNASGAPGGSDAPGV